METIPRTLPPALAHLTGKNVTIVAFGDSNTEQNHWSGSSGCCWVGLLDMGLCCILPQRVVINAGRSGSSLIDAAERLDRDVLRFDPDIVIIGFSANDWLKYPASEFGRRLRAIIQRIREHNPRCVIILRTATPVIDMFTGMEAECYCCDGKTISIETREEFAEEIRKTAKAEPTLLADHAASWKKSMESTCRGDLITLMGNPLHPKANGHRRIYSEIAPLFGALPNFFFEFQRILIDQDRLQG